MRGIIQTAEQVRAWLDGRRTTLRVPIKVQPGEYAGGVHPNNKKIHDAPYIDAYCSEPKTKANPRGMSDFWCWWTEDDRQGPSIGRCPIGAVGDTIAVREAWGRWTPCNCGECSKEPTVYRATWTGSEQVDRWRSPQHMPIDIARIHLLIESIRVERLQSISEADCRAEGCPVDDLGGEYCVDGMPSWQAWMMDRWDRTNKRHPWANNPCCWVAACRRVKP